jgi:plasmid stabilization system protein ParE
VNARKRPRFLLDLAEELTWLNDKAGSEVAERWYDALLATLQLIEKNPYVGRERKDLSPAGIRSWRVDGFPRWLVFYGVTQDKEIVFYRVRAGAMNLVMMRMNS